MAIKKSFVTRKSTHFCYRCGWIDDIEVSMEKRIYKDLNDEEVIDYYHIKTDKPLTCTDCKKTSVVPLTVGNTVYAVEYLLRSLR